MRQFVRMNRIVKAWMFALLPVVVWTGLLAQNFLPDAAVKGFELPYFDPKSNFLSMKLRGEEGLLRSDQNIDIRKLTILFYSKEAGEEAHTTITGSTATITPETTSVQGEQDLQVNSSEFTLEGKQWQWNWKDNKLVIKQDVQLLLKQEIGSILE